MKKILVIKGISAYNVLCRAVDEVCQGFRNCGYEVHMIDVTAREAEEDLMTCLEHAEEYAFYFSMQAILWNQEKDTWQELTRIKRVGWIVDDPVYHQSRLWGSIGKDAYVLTVSDSRTKQVREEFSKFEKIETLYHGGFKSESRVLWKEKNIDVFFPGTYTPLKVAEEKVKSIEGVFGTIACNVMNRIIGNNLASSWTEELRKYLDEIDFEIVEDEFLALQRALYPLDQYQRDYMRQYLIENLLKNGIKISVVGAGWDQYDGEGKKNLNVISAEGVDITEVVKMMQYAKIVINNTNILDGLHERIFTAMLAGAVCVTNEYKLLSRIFENGKEIVTFPLNDLDRLSGIIKDLLENPVRAEAIAEAGYQAAIAGHTWEYRGEQIARWMEDGKRFVYNEKENKSEKNTGDKRHIRL